MFVEEDRRDKFSVWLGIATKLKVQKESLNQPSNVQRTKQFLRHLITATGRQTVQNWQQFITGSSEA
jgi:hypothetical protein